MSTDSEVVGAPEVDSVPLNSFQEPSDQHRRGAKKGSAFAGASNLKLIFALFLIFVVIVSEVFVTNVLSAFGEKAVRCRNPTSWGTVLQGIFLVIFYIIAVYLIENRVL